MTAPLSRDGSPMVAVVMSASAATELAEACQFGQYRVEDWLDSDEGRRASPKRRDRMERTRVWLDWGQRWLIDGKRIDVPEECHS